MIDNNAMFSISYGLFVLTAKDNEFNNGCIVNTVMQVTDSPKQIVVGVNKNNKTHDMIVSSAKFNVSVISEKADFSLFKQFGFKSGKDTDKFSDFSDCKKSENDIYYITKGTNAYISCNVVKVIDCITHSLFVAEVTDAVKLNDENSATYDYYFKNIKPKPQKEAGSSKKFVCKICGYVYEGESLPEDFVCPLCKHGSDVFEEVV